MTISRSKSLSHMLRNKTVLRIFTASQSTARPIFSLSLPYLPYINSENFQKKLRTSIHSLEVLYYNQYYTSVKVGILE